MIWAAPTSADWVISAVQHILVLATTIGICSIYWSWRQLLVLAADIGIGDSSSILASPGPPGKERPEEENQPEGHILSKEFTYNSWP